MEARDVPEHEIGAALQFIRQPMSEGFRAWRTLRDRDHVTMTMRELGHLMAWYVRIRNERRTAPQQLNQPASPALLPSPVPESEREEKHAK